MKTIPLTENEINQIKELYSQELERLQKRSAEISSLLKKLKGDEGFILNVAGKNNHKPEKNNRKQPNQKNAQKLKANTVSEKGNIEKQTTKRGRPAKIKAAGNTEVVPKQTKEVKAPQEKKTNNKPAKAAKPKAVTVVKTAKPAKKKAEVKAVEKKKLGRKKSENSKKSRWTAAILTILEKKEKVLPSKEIINSIMQMQGIPNSEYAKTRSIVAGSLSDLKLETKKIKSISVPSQKGELYGLAQWFDKNGNLDVARR